MEVQAMELQGMWTRWLTRQTSWLPWWWIRRSLCGVYANMWEASLICTFFSPNTSHVYKGTPQPHTPSGNGLLRQRKLWGTTLTDYLNFYTGVVFPIKTVCCFPNNKPWITSDLKDFLDKKKKLFKDGERELKHVQEELKVRLREAKGHTGGRWSR